MSKLCIIPARGGSKRIPRKNIKTFLGKPIIAYSIEAALNSGLFDEVMVSTDDDEIAQVALDHSGSVPFKRTIQTADDHATTFEVMEEVISKYKSTGIDFDAVCCLYPCAPFVNSKMLKDAFQLLSENKYDSVFPVVGYGFPIQRALRSREGRLSFINPAHANTRSQDLEKSYHDTGQFYFASVASLLKNKSFITSNTGGIIVNEMECQDIDEPRDWKMAELKFQMYED